MFSGTSKDSNEMACSKCSLDGWDEVILLKVTIFVTLYRCILQEKKYAGK